MATHAPGCLVLAGRFRYHQGRLLPLPVWQLPNLMVVSDFGSMMTHARLRGGNRQEQQQVLPPRAPQVCRPDDAAMFAESTSLHDRAVTALTAGNRPIGLLEFEEPVGRPASAYP